MFKAVWWFMSGNLTEGMVKLFRTSNEEAMALCDERLERALDEVDALVEAKTGPYLGGDAPASDDIALAALVGPLSHPPEYVPAL